MLVTVGAKDGVAQLPCCTSKGFLPKKMKSEHLFVQQTRDTPNQEEKQKHSAGRGAEGMGGCVYPLSVCTLRYYNYCNYH